MRVYSSVCGPRRVSLGWAIIFWRSLILLLVVYRASSTYEENGRLIQQRADER